MGKLIDFLNKKSKALWIESGEYCSQLLAGGNPPLLDGTEYISWHTKSQSLVNSDVATFDALPVIKGWLESNAELLEVMAAKKRATLPLKRLLADEKLRAHLLAIVKGLRSSYSGRPLVLQIPSPHVWINESYRAAHGITPEVDGDAIDGASVYVADFLRCFSDSGLDGVLLWETEDTSADLRETLGLYQSVFNVAAKYRWDLGIKLPRGCPEQPGFDQLQFVIARENIPGLPTFKDLSDEFWGSDTALSAIAGEYFYLSIPVGSIPETVLTKLSSIK